MATFETQVEALTGISIDGSSTPTQTELSSFLVDGVIDVVNRMIEIRPAELSKFTKTTNSTGSVTKIGKVLSVVREHDSTSVLRKCAIMDPSDRYEATDSESLLYRSKTSPGFYELDGLIHTVPAAGSGNNDIVVTQIYYDTGLVFGDTYNAAAIENFPKDYERLVAIYAAIQTVQRKMGATIISVTAVPPNIPTLTSVTFASIDADIDATAPTTSTTAVAAASTYTGSAPTYTKPTVMGDGDELTDVSILDTDNTIDVHADQIEFDQWWTTVAHYIEGEEDTELAGTQLQKIATYISAFSQEMASAMNTFNQANIAYQSAIQESMQEVQIANAAQQSDAKAELQVAIDNEQRSQQRQLQNGINDMQAIIADNDDKIAKFSAELTQYSTDANAEIQEKTTKMEQYQVLYAQLKVEYNSAFVPIGAAE